MGTRLRAGEDSYDVGVRASGEGEPMRFDRLGAALAWVRRVRDEGALRRVLSEAEPLVWSLDDERVAQRVARLLFERVLVAVPVAPMPIPQVALSSKKSSSSGDGDGTPVLGPTEERVQEKTWIEIALVGEDKEPVSGERYVIKLPDGTTREGHTDSTGVVMLTGIDPGKCQISFPDLDRDAWAPV